MLQRFKQYLLEKIAPNFKIEIGCFEIRLGIETVVRL